MHVPNELIENRPNQPLAPLYAKPAIPNIGTKWARSQPCLKGESTILNLC